MSGESAFYYEVESWRSGILLTLVGSCEPKEDVFSANECGVFCNFALHETCASKGESCDIS